MQGPSALQRPATLQWASALEWPAALDRSSALRWVAASLRRPALLLALFLARRLLRLILLRLLLLSLSHVLPGWSLRMRRRRQKQSRSCGHRLRPECNISHLTQFCRRGACRCSSDFPSDIRLACFE